MAFSQVSWFSQVLGKHVAMNVLLPDVGKPPFPVFYLLHGLSDDYSVWHRRTRIEHYARELPLIVVMPDGYRGFYTNNDQGPAYAKYMGEELPAFVERTFQAKTTGAARCIGGLSMGGYGALRIGLGYAGRYTSLNSHSGAVIHGSQDQDPKNAEMVRIYGLKPQGTDHDTMALLKKARRAGKLPKMLIDCGTGDFLIQQNRDFHAALDKLNVEHTYAEFPGVHDWDYWDTHVRDALQFHCKALKIPYKA